MNLPICHIRSTGRSLSALVALGLVALSACGGDETAAGGTTVPDTTAPTTPASTAPPTTLSPTTVAPTTLPPTTLAPTTVAPTTVAPTTVAPTTIPPTTVAPTTVAPTVPPDASCLIGDWEVADADLEAYFEEVLANTAWSSIEHDGTMAFAFSGSSYTRTLDLTVTMESDDAVYVGTHDSTARQPYRVAAAGQLGATGDLTIEGGSSFTKDGEPFTEDPGDLFIGIIPIATVDAFTYSCDGPTLTVGAGPGPDDTFDLPLTPA